MQITAFQSPTNISKPAYPRANSSHQTAPRFQGAPELMGMKIHPGCFVPSESLGIAFDRLLNPITGYLPFGIGVKPLLPNGAILRPALVSREGLRNGIRYDISRRLEGSLWCDLRNLSDFRKLPYDPNFYDPPHLKDTEVQISDGQNFAPWFKALIMGTLDLIPGYQQGWAGVSFMRQQDVPTIPPHAKRDAVIRQLCQEYTQHIAQNSTGWVGIPPIEVKNGKIIVDFNKPPKP